ncbi:DUF1131 family protein [Roseibium limicola]|uniref:DUF1131 family protein n=1 Tax=Roseibium limicola TaxID=2816037 RepID=A0A939ENR2_9HYPH|nr:DUF1131 family protein [Roseibium limicola]MBO0345272.1 DUF1131 family protein [Roseibium limicola]
MGMPLFGLKFASFALAASLLAACSPTMDYQGDGPGPIEQTSSVTLIQITNDSVGGITPETRYSAKAIEAALPGFTTEGVQTAVENTTEWATAVFNSDGFQVLQVFKDSDGSVREVHGVTHHLAGPNGERIGRSFYNLGLNRRDCRVGRSLWRGMAICKAKNAPNVKLVLAIPGYDGPFDQLPPDIALQDSLLQRILWQPKG